MAVGARPGTPPVARRRTTTHARGPWVARARALALPWNTHPGRRPTGAALPRAPSSAGRARGGWTDLDLPASVGEAGGVGAPRSATRSEARTGATPHGAPVPLAGARAAGALGDDGEVVAPECGGLAVVCFAPVLCPCRCRTACPSIPCSGRSFGAQVLFVYYPSSKVSAAGHVHVIMCGHGAGVARVNFALGSFVTPACTFYRE